MTKRIFFLLDSTLADLEAVVLNSLGSKVFEKVTPETLPQYNIYRLTEEAESKYDTVFSFITKPEINDEVLIPDNLASWMDTLINELKKADYVISIDVSDFQGENNFEKIFLPSSHYWNPILSDLTLPGVYQKNFYDAIDHDFRRYIAEFLSGYDRYLPESKAIYIPWPHNLEDRFASTLVFGSMYSTYECLRILQAREDQKAFSRDKLTYLMMQVTKDEPEKITEELGLLLPGLIKKISSYESKSSITKLIV